MAVTETDRLLRDYQRFITSKEYQQISSRLNRRIDEVVATAGGSKTKHNLFGLRKLHETELFHARFDDLVNPRWIAGQEFHAPSSVGETIVHKAIAARNWEIVTTEDGPSQDPLAPIHTLSTTVTYRTPNDAIVSIRRYSTYQNLRLFTDQENPEFIPSYEPHEDIVITIQANFPSS